MTNYCRFVWDNSFDSYQSKRAIKKKIMIIIPRSFESGIDGFFFFSLPLVSGLIDAACHHIAPSLVGIMNCRNMTPIRYWYRNDLASYCDSSLYLPKMVQYDGMLHQSENYFVEGTILGNTRIPRTPWVLELRPTPIVVLSKSPG